MTNWDSPQVAAAYLAGLIDGEGCMVVPTRYIEITNTDPEIMDAVATACDCLDLHYLRRGPLTNGTKKNGSPCALIYEVRISHRSTLIKVQESVPLRSKSKRDKLEEMLASYTERGLSFAR